jgi:UDP-N-acetylglucosamine--N-acetylmuramyl-(pentapeptide) pyrophosphoryl-undecaprenol N-acetylglucosamine transferase
VTARILDALPGRRLLLTASTGGHLAQLSRLAELLDPAEDSLWVTFDKPQSRSLLAERRHRFIPYIAPRDIGGVVRGARWFDRLLRDERFDAVVSTGAAIALASHLPAVRRGVPALYIESVSRFDGPSLTGRLLQRLPRVELHAQHPGYGGRWRHDFSVLDAYTPALGDPVPPRRLLVTLGTIEPYRFDALVDAVLRAAPDGTEFVWQLGSTTRDDLPGEVHRELSAEDFARAARTADLVVTHAGVGTVMGLLDQRRPVLVVPRRRSRNEHVDDHQLQLTRELTARGIAVTAEVDEIDADVLARATGVGAL